MNAGWVSKETSFLYIENIMLSFNDLKANDGSFHDFSSNEFDFPLQATPLFRSLASGVPSPQFTESVS